MILLAPTMSKKVWYRKPGKALITVITGFCSLPAAGGDAGLFYSTQQMLHFYRRLPLKSKPALASRPFSDSSGKGTWQSAFKSAKKALPVKLFIVALPVGGVVALLSGTQVYSQLKLFFVDAVELIRDAIEKSKAASWEDTHYVKRPVLESKVSGIVEANSRKGDCYCIIYGPKGAGKTEIAAHYAKDKTALVKLLVNRADSSADVIAALSKQLLGRRVKAELGTADLVAAVSKSSTIILEVERGDDHKTMVAVRSLAKALATVCRCIIVLSEANEVLEFGKDTSRERFLYVGEMTHQEAKELIQLLLKKKEYIVDGTMFEFGDKVLQNIFDTIGTKPSMLIDLVDEVVTENVTVEQFVADQLDNAAQELSAFPHQQILKALREHPEGVSPAYFKKQENKGVDLSNPKAVGAAMKDSNAIVYRTELRQYQLASTAHKTALKSYHPVLPRWWRRFLAE